MESHPARVATFAAGLAGLILLCIFAVDLGPAGPAAHGFQLPTPTPALDVPSFVVVEVRPDRSVSLEWSQSSGATGYEVGVRTAINGPIPASAWTVVAIADAPIGPETVRRVIKPIEDWPAIDTVAYEFAIRSTTANQSWSLPAPVTVGLSVPEISAGSLVPNVLNISWTPAPAGQPFARYEIFLGSALDRIGDCPFSQFSSRDTAVTNTSTVSPDCGGTPLTGATAYTAGIRIVRNQVPLVVDEISVTTGSTGNGQALPTERFSTAQVNGTWEIVDVAGEAVIWQSINVRRGELGSYVFDPAEFVAMLDQGFDSVRVVMTWEDFEQQAGVFDPASFAALDQTVDWAETAGMDLILDPLHLSEGPQWNIPDWAWAATNNGVQDDDVILDVVRENATDYLRFVTQRYRSRAHVVALDLVNEPREPAQGLLDDRNGELVTLYHDLVGTVRDLETDKPLILQPFYGSALISNERLADLASPTVSDPNPVAEHYTNLIWSLHDYYAGREGSAIDDGYTSGGYPLGGAAPDGTSYRTSSFSSTGCYPSGPTSTDCTGDTSRPAVLRPSMLLHVQRHFEAAQAAGLPLFVSEFGIPHESVDFAGWAGAEEYLTDKVDIYDRLGVSRGVWIWRTDVDPTFGLYNRTTETWHPLTAYATGAASVPVEVSPLGDVNCDAQRNIVDALLIAQFTVSNRIASPCPLGDPATQINSANGDLNTSGAVDIVDALLLAQCSAGVVNDFC